jgi:2-polyprenyl-3-methyl-5-hydroxy-6-metoxy-1,4-benzoquinol methylase
MLRRGRNRLRVVCHRPPPDTDMSDVGGATPDATADVEVVESLERLDEKLREIDEAYKISDDAMRAVFQSFRLQLPASTAVDPWSDEYRAEQFELYRRLSSRGEYRSTNETSGYEVDSRIPFPYYTKSSETVSNQLLAIGFMVKVMALPPGASVLEYGAGWGNTTITLARMGCDVHAIDIDDNFVQMIAARAARLGLDVRAETGQFLDVSELDGVYDAVVFYECFHHCSDHHRLLDELHQVVKPGGKVVLAAEPIHESFHAPWGLRLDGESLWAIRSNGWLELGFKESYFIETCLRAGWSLAKHVTDVTPMGTVFVLTSTRGQPVAPGHLVLPPADDAGWAIPDSPSAEQRYTRERSRLVVATGRPDGGVVVDLVNPAPHRLHVRIEHGASRWESTVQPGTTESARLAYDPGCGELFVGAPTWVPAASIPGSTDTRSIGVGVRSVSVP